MESTAMEGMSPRGRATPRVGLLLVVAAALAALAAAAVVPNLLASNLCSNETAAIATLRNLAACQSRFRASGAVDTDGDGIGEFGTIRELAGSVPLRTAAGRPGGTLSPPVLSPALERVTTEGWVEKSHYAFAVFLPRSGGGWIRESGAVAAGPAAGDAGCDGSGDAAPGTGGVSAVGTVDADGAEREWCAIAWPRMIGDRTRRIFVVTSAGEVFHAPNDRGVSCGTRLPGGPAGVLPAEWRPGEPLRGGYTSRDGDVWHPTH